jgi:hypothetical protein
MALPSFWDAFWPAVWATAFGVALGFPVALAIDRLVRSGAARDEAKRDEARLADLRRSLGDAITRNLGSLQELVAVPADAVMPLSGLETALWEVWKGDVIELVRDPLLRGDLALFFDDLNRVESLNRELIRLTTSTDAALIGSEAMRSTVRRLLTENAAKAGQGGQEVAERLAAHGLIGSADRIG